MLFLWLVLLQIAIFVALILFLKLIIARNLNNATSHLHTLNEDYTQKLDDAKKRQQEAEKYYDETVIKAKADAEKTKVQILKEATDAQNFALNQARQQSEDILKQGSNARDAMLKAIDDRIEQCAMEKACELVQEALPHEINESMHGKWVEQILKEGLDGLSKLNLPETLSEAEVTSAYPLNEDQKKLLRAKIKEQLSRDLPLNEKVSKDLIAGFRIVLGAVVIDGSLQFKIKEMVRNASQRRS